MNDESSPAVALSLVHPAVETTEVGVVRFSVPAMDTDEFSTVVKKAKNRSELLLTLGVLERVHLLHGTEGDFRAKVERLACGDRHLNGFSGDSLLRKYYAFMRAGCSWRVLVKGWKAPSQQPAEFVEFIRGLIEQNPRSAEAALTKFREELWPDDTVSIPGYGTWREWFRATYPAHPEPVKFPRIWPQGWSIRNLKNYGPTKAEKKIYQQGIGAAHSYLLTLRRDPSKLRPMEWIVIDDFQLDVMCTFRGDAEKGIKPQVAYAGGLLAMCVGTRKKLAWLWGPMIERPVPQPDGTTKMVRSYVRAIDVQALIYTVFRNNGLPDYDVTIICETRSATISPALELMLSTTFGGRIRVKRTSLINHKTLTNGYCEGGGTPWEKGWIESEFNYLWNKMADLPGYKGSNERLNAPGDHDAKVAAASKFLEQGKGKLNLPPEIVDHIATGFLSVEELDRAFAFVIERSEMRTKHRFLGFDTVTDYVWSKPALPAPAGIDPHGPNSFRTLALLTKQEQTIMIPEERKESAIERWEKLSAANPRAKLNSGVLALFLLSPNKATWRNHAVTFTRDKQGFSYVDDAGLMADVLEGTELLAYVDPASPGSALITRLDGAQIGVLRMLGNSPRGVDVTDPEAMAEARARRAAIVNRVLATVRNRPLHVATNQKLLADRQHSEAIVAAYTQATTSLPVAEKIAVAQGRAGAVQHERTELARSVQRTADKLSTEDVSDFLASEQPATPAQPAPAEASETMRDYL